MQKQNQIGKEIPKSKLSQIKGGYGSNGNPQDGKPYGLDKVKGFTTPEDLCRSLLFNMTNHSYVLNADGSDPLRDLWNKNNCDNIIHQP
jgi:hypothetical protein